MDLITDVASIAVVIGLVEVFKQIGLTNRFAPLASVILGIVAAFLTPTETIGLTIFHGIVLGLSASGLYSGSKATVSK